jgi:RNA polymerase sigma-70 factor (ECF subfamily)
MVKVTRNRLVNRAERAALEADHAAAQKRQGHPDVSKEPAPADVVAAEDTWQRLLALCPPAHRDLLRLKRDGVSLDEIAARTGLHKSSVRRILYDLMHQFLARPGGTITASAAHR